MATILQMKKMLSAPYDSLVILINRIKQNDEIGFFDRLELKALLKESEDIAKQFVKFDQLIHAHEEANSIKIATLVKLMDQELLDSMKAIISNKPQPTDILNGIDRLNRMLAEKDRYRIYRMKKMTVGVRDLRVQRNDDADVLYAKADFLLDQCDRLNVYSRELDQAIEYLQYEDHLKKQAAKIDRIMQDADIESAGLKANFADSLFALQRLPLSKTLIAPLDDYETLLERLILEKEASEAKSRLYLDKADDFRDIADYKNKVWLK